VRIKCYVNCVTVCIVEAWFTAPLLCNGLHIVVTRLRGKVFTGPLPSNGIPTAACTCVAGMRLPSRCPATGIHVTIQ
jgi:hypothetical protein